MATTTRGWKQDETSRFRMRARTGILSQDRWPGHFASSGRKEDITGTREGSSRKVGGTYERVHMYVHAGIRATSLCLARGDCPIVTRDRRDRFHLWSRMVMIPEKRKRDRGRTTGSHGSLRGASG